MTATSKLVFFFLKQCFILHALESPLNKETGSVKISSPSALAQGMTTKKAWGCSINLHFTFHCVGSLEVGLIKFIKETIIFNPCHAEGNSVVV